MTQRRAWVSCQRNAHAGRTARRAPPEAGHGGAWSPVTWPRFTERSRAPSAPAEGRVAACTGKARTQRGRDTPTATRNCCCHDGRQQQFRNDMTARVDRDMTARADGDMAAPQGLGPSGWALWRGPHARPHGRRVGEAPSGAAHGERPMVAGTSRTRRRQDPDTPRRLHSVGNDAMQAGGHAPKDTTAPGRNATDRTGTCSKHAT